jgi:hypothetical protein
MIKDTVGMHFFVDLMQKSCKHVSEQKLFWTEIVVKVKYFHSQNNFSISFMVLKAEKQDAVYMQ